MFNKIIIIKHGTQSMGIEVHNHIRGPTNHELSSCLPANVLEKEWEALSVHC